MDETLVDATGVTVRLAGDDGTRFEGAAILRTRPDPRTARPALQLGIPDDALGFRPRRGASYRLQVVDPLVAVTYRSTAVWLDRVQSSWWFILDERVASGE